MRASDELIILTKQGDVDRIGALLKPGFDIDTRDRFGFTMLLEAAVASRCDSFLNLIKRGAVISVTTPEDSGIVHAIALGGDTTMFEYAVNHGCSWRSRIRSGDQSGMCVIDFAVLGKTSLWRVA